MRSPNWHEDEVKLALDLYLNKDIEWCSRMSDKTFEIMAFSQLLNGLDYYDNKPEKFRSTGSIRMKLANFMSLDKRYNKNSLGNVAENDRKIWDIYSQKKEILHQECQIIIRDHLKTISADASKYIELLNLKDKETYDSNFTNFVASLKRSLHYYERIAEQSPDIQYSSQVKNWCQQTIDSLKWIDNIETIEFEQNAIYKEHAGINLAPINKRKKASSKSNLANSEEEKIGKLVNRTFQELVSCDKISDELISFLLTTKYSKETFGLKPAFLIKIDKSKSIKEQIVDERGYVRYWTTPIDIHGNYYCITKEWYPNQRERYLSWYNRINVKPFCMIKAKKFKEILQFIQKMDSKNISISKSELFETFSTIEIETIVNLLIEKGILVGYQGSTKELVVDDYDTLYKMINSPSDYSME